MQLDKLELTNFKCFSRQTLRFSKLTVLLGANSSGKSSLLQGILAAIQTDEFPLRLSPNGPLVELGDLRGLVHGHKTSAEVGIGLAVSDPVLGAKSCSGMFKLSKKNGMPELTLAEISDGSFSAEISREGGYRADWTFDEQKDLNLRAMEPSISVDVQRLSAMVGSLFAEMMSSALKSNPSAIPRHDSDGPSFAEMLAASPPSSGSFSFTAPGDLYAQIAKAGYYRLLSHVSSLFAVTSMLKLQMNYIGSFRREPQRSYYRVSKRDLRSSRDGLNAIEQIADWQEKGASELGQLAGALSDLGLLSRVETTLLGSGLFEVMVRPKSNGVAASLPDVGFGISQLLPILVADLQLPQGGTLAVCQPEIHLHPSVQADLAEYFVRNIHSRKTRYIVETHSEYFLNRLRAMIAKGSLNPEDLSVVYLTNDGAKTTAHEIHLLPNGRIEGAPEDFFKTYMIDVMDIALSASKQ